MTEVVGLQTLETPRRFDTIPMSCWHTMWYTDRSCRRTLCKEEHRPLVFKRKRSTWTMVCDKIVTYETSNRNLSSTFNVISTFLNPFLSNNYWLKHLIGVQLTFDWVTCMYGVWWSTLTIFDLHVSSPNGLDKTK